MKRMLFVVLSMALACVLAQAMPATVFAKTLAMTDAFAVLDIVHAKVPYHEDLDINLAGEGSYAVAFWSAAHGHPSGSALLKESGGHWALVKLVNPSFNQATVLESLGVPAAQAKALLADMRPD